MPRLSNVAIAMIKAANPLEYVIGKQVKLGRPNAQGIVAGACLCSPVKGKSPLWVNTCKGTFGCHKPNGCGGDLFSYLERFEGLDFTSAVRALGGAEVERDEVALAETRAKREVTKAERLACEAELLECQRSLAFKIWQRTKPAAGTLVDDYFRHRGLEPIITSALRFSAIEPFYIVPDAPNARFEIVHRGPCMVAAIQGPDGKFCGVHRTWLDPQLLTDNGRAAIVLPDGTLANARKTRGLKKRGAIRLRDCRNLEAGDDWPAPIEWSGCYVSSSSA